LISQHAGHSVRLDHPGNGAGIGIEIAGPFREGRFEPLTGGLSEYLALIAWQDRAGPLGARGDSGTGGVEITTGRRRNARWPIASE